MKYNLILLLIFILMSCRCSKIKFWESDELSIQTVPFTGEQLRIDGYYYQLFEGRLHGVNCFYKNGVLQHLGSGYKLSEIEDFEQRINAPELIENRKKVKYYWGVFQIEGNQIKFERWYPSQAPYRAYVRAGTILNDTTFHITESYRMQGGKKTEVREKDETYHFRHFSPKPDSTNPYIP